MNGYIGIDFGTSGSRAVVINTEREVVAETQCSFSSTLSADEFASTWKLALFEVIQQIPIDIRTEVNAIAINGTSATVLLCDQTGIPVENPILYNDSRGVAVLEFLKLIAPADHCVLSATSSLAKLMGWLKLNPSNFTPEQFASFYFLHQADWLAFLLHGKLGISDYHNSLKLGYDVETLSYPDWLIHNLQQISPVPLPHLPQVLAPGTMIGNITSEIADQFNLPKTCVVCAGTTDSIAAFLASGATLPGEAVTSLGSTLVLKLLSSTRIDDAKYGIYSHRFGNLWLTGGASNTGGAVLRHYFSNQELTCFSQEIDPKIQSELNYYPLLKKGDRFPVNNPELLPELDPRPENPVEFLHGLLESIARIEAQGYQLLQQLGATPLQHVYTAGGGAKNSTWQTIRQRYLQVPMLQPIHPEAAYGTALLALQGYESHGQFLKMN